MKLIITILFSIQFISAGEVLPIEIPLKGEAAERNLEMSGLAWYGDNLILMPQYVNKEAPRFCKYEVSSGLPVEACTSYPRFARILIATLPTPPAAPVTRIGPESGATPFSSKASTHSIAV